MAIAVAGIGKRSVLLATIRLRAAGTRFSWGDALRTDSGGIEGLKLRQKLQ
ncbi:hypothetical protein [Nostoc sp. CALU 546]|uniref:hypothetical protein n=1 Tax=Nostoc sp. CALU 546 TaxID=1867241 RepID=UPI003B685039